ncbi:uncharacterized protein [Henckelia pumila]|uniref:uncharacterized protein isoform X2 n=1 Tax=Henckelia pumila TaxID=405737 RepID=UPI003C6E7CD4
MHGNTNMYSLIMRHRLRNNSNKTLYVTEKLSDNRPTTYWIRLEPYETSSDFKAAKYKNNFDVYTGCLTMIVIFVDGYQASGGLNPWEYVSFFELIFDIDEGSNTLIVSGIQAKSSDYFPCRGRQKEIIMVSGFKAFKPENEGRLFSDDKEMVTIYVMVNYDGERKKNDEGGFTWSSGAHTKWKAILFVKNQLSLDGVTHQICATLGLNSNEVKIMFSDLPENIADSYYFKDSRRFNIYLTLNSHVFKTIPQLHVKIDVVKSNDTSSNMPIQKA